MKLKLPGVEVLVFGNKCHWIGDRLVVQRIWNCSFVGAVHLKVTPLVLATMLLKAGTAFVVTKTAKVLVTLFAGTPLSVTLVVMKLVIPFCASVGVQVMMPVGLMVTRLVQIRLLVTV